MTTELQVRERLRTDLPYYTEHALQIKTKEMTVESFILNRAQRYIHDIVEGQLKSKGYIRCLILKGRQQGCSTYVSGRFYWKVSQSFATNARVMAHDKDTSDVLFEMTQIYHDKCPPELKPSTSAASGKRFIFDALNSGYRVSTAGSPEGGRGATTQFLHGSEFALWVNADKLFKGLMQSIPSGKNINGTEVFLESTAQGPAGKFYDMWMKATHEDPKKRSNYIAIFTPWWWSDEYADELPHDDVFEPTEEEAGYKDRNGLTDEQILWRRNKINDELDEDGFKQEYPETAEEAFEYSEKGAFFKRDKVMKCAEEKNVFQPYVGARVGALDPSGGGSDSDRICIGYGDDMAIREIEYREALDPYQQRKLAENYIDEHKLDAFYIDATGIGATMYAEMKHGRHKNIVRSFVASGSTSTFVPDRNGKPKPVYANRRAEAYGMLRDWIGDGLDHQIPNNQELINDICAPRQQIHKKQFNIVAESKEDMDNRGIPSPDGLDVCAMIKCEKVRNSLTKESQYDMVPSTEYDALNFGLE